VFVQDAHDSLEAQENIAKIISGLVSDYGVKTVFEEGYEGPVPTEKYFGFIKDPKIKEKVSYFFLDKLRVGGAEYAHINRTQEFDLIGADSLKLHKENVDQYRLSAAKKDGITRDLNALEKEIRSLADARFPKELKEWLKVKEQFDAKKMDLFTYLARTLPLLGTRDTYHAPRAVARETWPVVQIGLLQFVFEAMKSNDPVVIENAKHIDAREVFEELLKLEQAVAEAFLQESADKQLFKYYKTLGILRRLNELQVSPEEYEAAKEMLRSFDTDSFARFIYERGPKTLILSRMWERNIKDAIKFYEIARQRDSSLSKVLDKYLLITTKGRATIHAPRTTDNEEQIVDRGAWTEPAPAVLVFGGFHKENIKRILEAKGLSYIVVSPRMTRSSPRHEMYYKRLMTEDHHAFEMPFLAARASRPLTLFTAPSDAVAHAEIQA
ncbi:MAG: hypothetical protein HY767_02235, partial [Candidatus Omnitrophica bacterium]|nr:hypothetical protein [Candidatus Omnitrophota bacterium]